MFDKKGVSPVVGTILLIAITVALAAIVATLVSGLGGRGTPPSAMLSVTAKDISANGTVTLTIQHTGGDDLVLKDIKITASDNSTAMVTCTAPTTGSLTVGGTITATYPWGVTSAVGQTITVFVIHNPSKQKIFSSTNVAVN